MGALTGFLSSLYTVIAAGIQSKLLDAHLSKGAAVGLGISVFLVGIGVLIAGGAVISFLKECWEEAGAELERQKAEREKEIDSIAAQMEAECKEETVECESVAEPGSGPVPVKNSIAKPQLCDLRRAFVMSEVLGKPRALKPSVR